MYHQLEFKLSVEMQYKKATDNMLKLYQTDGDKKILQDTKLKQWESNKKIHLLQAALKKYRNLHVMEEDGEGKASLLYLVLLHVELLTHFYLRIPDYTTG
jgi:hypothetical protein